MLESRDPARIAKAISRSPAVERSGGVITALLYTAHMLSIPVRLGVDRVARSQAFFWSVRHSLSGLECAVMLSKWLSSLTASATTTPLSGMYKTSHHLCAGSVLTRHQQIAKTEYCTGSGALWKRRTTSWTLRMTSLTSRQTGTLPRSVWPSSRFGHTSSRATRSGPL